MPKKSPETKPGGEIKKEGDSHNTIRNSETGMRRNHGEDRILHPALPAGVPDEDRAEDHRLAYQVGYLHQLPGSSRGAKNRYGCREGRDRAGR